MSKGPWVEWPGEGRLSFGEWMADNSKKLDDSLWKSVRVKSAESDRWLPLLCLDAVWGMLVPRRFQKVDEVEIDGKVIDWSRASVRKVRSGLTEWTRSDHSANILAIDHDEISDEEFVSAMTWWAGEP